MGRGSNAKASDTSRWSEIICVVLWHSVSMARLPALHPRTPLSNSPPFRWTTKASEKEAADALASEQAAVRRQQHEKLKVDVEYLKNEVNLLRAQLDDVTATGLRKCKPSGDK